MKLIELQQLPMDKASRLSRAKAMGFDTDTVWYHGSSNIKTGSSDIIAFDVDVGELGIHFGSSKIANNRLKDDDPEDESNIYPVFLSLKNPFDIVSDLGQWDMETLGEYLVDDDYGPFTGEEFDNFRNTGDVRKGLLRKGYDGMTYINMGGGGGEGDGTGDESNRSMIVFKPSDIRSIHAAFDPSTATSSDIREMKR